MSHLETGGGATPPTTGAVTVTGGVGTGSVFDIAPVQYIDTNGALQTLPASTGNDPVDGATNYYEIDASGNLVSNTTEFTDGNVPMFVITTDGTGVVTEVLYLDQLQEPLISEVSAGALCGQTRHGRTWFNDAKVTVPITSGNYFAPTTFQDVSVTIQDYNTGIETFYNVANPFSSTDFSGSSTWFWRVGTGAPVNIGTRVYLLAWWFDSGSSIRKDYILEFDPANPTIFINNKYLYETQTASINGLVRYADIDIDTGILYIKSQNPGFKLTGVDISSGSAVNTDYDNIIFPSDPFGSTYTNTSFSDNVTNISGSINSGIERGGIVYKGKLYFSDNSNYNLAKHDLASGTDETDTSWPQGLARNGNIVTIDGVPTIRDEGGNVGQSCYSAINSVYPNAI